MSVRLRELVVPALLLAVGLWAHWPGGLVFKSDDYPAIAWACDWGNVAHDFVGPQYDLRFFLFWRPLITLSLAVDHALFGLDPFGYHLMNALAAVLAAWLLYRVARLLLPRPGAGTAALALALLWLLNPTTRLSTSWVVGRVDTHVVPPMLAALWFLLRRRRGGPAWPVALCTLLAFMAKESALGLPLLMLGVELLDRHDPGRGVRLLGRRVLSLSYLAVIPAYLLFRKLVLGEFLGGYGFMQQGGLDVVEVAKGLLATLVSGLGGSDSPVVILVLLAVPTLGVTILWYLSEARPAPFVGMLLLGAGLFGPLLQLLPSMTNPALHRYAYLADVWPLSIWVLGFISGPWMEALANAQGRRPLLRVFGFGLMMIPVAWFLPLHVLSSRSHDDLIVRQTVAALREHERGFTERGSPIPIEDPEQDLFHNQRFLWGLGSVLKPPFDDSALDVVTLRPFHPLADPVLPAQLEGGIEGRLFVRYPDAGGMLKGGGVEWRPAEGPLRLRRAEPLGFDGTLDPALLDRMVDGDEAGWAVGSGYGGFVHVLTSAGSFRVPVEAAEGRLRLARVLLADVMWSQPAGHEPIPALFLLWNVLDLARSSRVWLYWHEDGLVARAWFRPSRDLPDHVWRALKRQGK
ncbi:MAG: glycosyltransferase family 39 protein [Planctomycetota bacterium]